jgi:NAD(P)-dependent dehydrogenase (short-subunit alcohol dehydrogenase family)
MASEGAVVVGVDNHRDRLDEAVAALRGRGGRAHGRLCDALDAGQVEATIAAVEEEFGGVDILVNAVGGSTIIANSGAGVDELTFADWQRLIDFNLSGTFLFTHAVVPIMKRRQRGKIVNLASIAGRGLSPTSSVLCGGERQDHRFTHKLAFGLGPFRVDQHAISAEPHLDRAHPPALGEADTVRRRRSRARAAASPRPPTRPRSSAFWPRATPTS